jgi:hypothetical protein
VANHHRNFFKAIRGLEPQNCGIDLAVKVQTVISLAEMSERLGMMCYFDEKTRRVTDGMRPLDHADHLRHAAEILILIRIRFGPLPNSSSQPVSARDRLLFSRPDFTD